MSRKTPPIPVTQVEGKEGKRNITRRINKGIYFLFIICIIYLFISYYYLLIIIILIILLSLFMKFKSLILNI
jgi:hypothetical protein